MSSRNLWRGVRIMARRKSRSQKFSGRFRKKRTCRFCEDPKLVIDYKNVELLKKYMSERGKIVARRISGNCSKHQRMVARAIKRARYLALVPYTVDIYRSPGTSDRRPR